MIDPAAEPRLPRRRAATPPRLRAALLLTTAAALTGCGPKNYANENDRLRAQVLDLTEKSQQLQTELTATQKALAAQQSEAHVSAQPLPEGVALPVASRLEIGSYSGRVQNGVRLYLETYDQKGRFIPAVGSVRVTISYVLPGKPAVTVATASLTPQQFDASYRAGFLGTHYTLTIPLTAPVPPEVKELIASVSFTDLKSGATLKAEKPIRATD